MRGSAANLDEARLPGSAQRADVGDSPAAKPSAGLDTSHYATALESLSQGICFFDGAQTLILANRRYGEIYGLARGLPKPGTSIRQVMEMREAAGTGFVQNVHDHLTWFQQVARAKKPHSFMAELQDGRTISIHNQPLADGGWVATHEDVTLLRRSEAQLKHMARFDALTQLPNRFHFMDLLMEILRRPDPRVAVLCVDIDKFKEVNDALGHAVGDLLLRETVARIRSLLDDTAILGRLGGDDFAISLPSIRSLDDAADLADRIIEAMALPFHLDGYETVVGVSIGIAHRMSDAAPLDFERLLRQAEMALCRAKGDGHGGYRVFEPAMDVRRQVRKTLETSLRRALRNDEFEVHYQPKVDSRRERITGVEALARWRDPERGLISPADFIPLAEETGLILGIGEKVLRMACARGARWRPLRIAVNLSALQVRQRGLADLVETILRDTDFEPDRLELEITESTLLHDTEIVLNTLNRLKKIGVRIAMDDFGTGYSSLGYLQRFPFDRLKIDRSFVRDIADKPTAGKIVKATIDMGHALGIETTAEGVESRQQIAVLHGHGCDELQGFYFAKPMTADAFEQFQRDYVAAGTDQG